MLDISDEARLFLDRREKAGEIGRGKRRRGAANSTHQMLMRLLLGQVVDRRLPEMSMTNRPRLFQGVERSIDG